MSVNYPFDRDDVFPSFFANRVQDQISGLDSKLWLRIVTTNTVEVVATAGDGIASLFIEGRWRFVTAPVQRVVAGTAGWRSVWATGLDSEIVSLPVPFTDNTDYAFALLITAEGDVPTAVPGSVEVWTRIGRLYWDATKIVHLQPLIGYRPRPAGELVPDIGATDDLPNPPGLIKADGTLVDISAYPAIFGRVGHAHSGGVDPGGGKFRLPEGTGRLFFGRGPNSAVNTVGKKDAMAAAARSPSHSHTVDAHAHTGPEHTHTVPGHFHGRGTLAVASASGLFDAQAWWFGSGFSSSTFGLVSSNIFGGAYYTNIPGGPHVHGLTGLIGNTTGPNGDAALASSGPSPAVTGEASPGTDTMTLPYITGTWMITTGE